MNRGRIYKGVFFVCIIGIIYSVGVFLYTAHAEETALQLNKHSVRMGKQIFFQNIRGDETFHSNKPLVAYVNSKGVITGKRPGKATITVRRGSEKIKSVQIHVKKVKRMPNLAVCLDELNQSEVYLTEQSGQPVFAIDVKNLSRKYKIKKCRLSYKVQVLYSLPASPSGIQALSGIDEASSSPTEYTVTFVAQSLERQNVRTLYTVADKVIYSGGKIIGCKRSFQRVSAQKSFAQEEQGIYTWGYNTKDKKAPVFRGFIKENSYHNADVYMVMYPDSDWSFRKYVSAWDKRDGKVKFIVDTSHVNKNKKGVYRVWFQAQDTAGNIARTWAKVQVRQLAGVDSYADTILRRITRKGWSDVRKCKAIYSYVKSHMSYVDYDGGKSWESSALRAIRYNNGNCYAYYSLSRLLMTRAGIPNMMITRYPAIAHHHHWWNLVYVKKGWYHFDTVSRRSGGRFCLLTEAQIKRYSRVDSYAFQFPSDAYPKRATKVICPGPF